MRSSWLHGGLFVGALALAMVAVEGCSENQRPPVQQPPQAPLVTTDPADQTVVAGQTATFAVVATGTAPLSYQWRRSGTAVMFPRTKA